MPSLWRLLAPIFGLMGARLAGAAFGFLSQLALARAFPPYQVGVAFLAISVTTFVSLLVTGGYHTIGLAYLARFQAWGRTRLTTAFLSASLRDMAILWCLAGILAGSLWFLPVDRGMAAAGFWGTLAAIPLSLIRLNNSMANAQRRFALSYVPDFVVRPALLLGLILILVAIGARQSALPLLIALPVIALAVAIGQGLLMGPDNVLRRWQFQGPDLRRKYRPRAISMLAVTIVSGATADLVVLVAGFLLPPEEVAVLGVAIRIAALVGFFALASQQFVLRDLVAARSSGDPLVLNQLLLRTNLAGAGTMAVAVLAALLLGHLVLALFGETYEDAYLPMVIFLISQAVRVMGGLNAQLLALGGHQIRSAAICLAALGVLVVGSLVLTPIWGVLGIAVATLAAEIFWALRLAVLTQRLEGRRADLFFGWTRHHLLIPRR